jgi:membrane-bound lytic murein transglycosylase D
MTGLKILLSSSASLALLGGLVGCAPATVSPWRASFLPPPPASPAARAVTPDPPPIDTRLELSAPPHFFTPGALAARPGRAEAVIREADFHYQAGRRHYQDGDQDGARREFDRAIDVLLAAPDEPALRPALDNKLEELVEAIHRLDLAGLGSADIVPEPVFEKPPLEDIPPLTFPYDPKLRHQVIEELRATASQLPLEVNDEVISYINYFSTARGRKILVAGLKRAGRYRSLIQRIFDEEGVPQELIFLAQAESGFLPRAVSRMRATGMWQFML